MFNTIKSKIFAIVVSMLIVLVSILGLFTCLYYHDTQNMIKNRVSKNVETKAQDINKDLVKIEKNAKSLALMGELYYKFDRDKSVAEKTVIQVFKNYPESLGGGIWFKPYYVSPSKKYDCIYAFYDKPQHVVIDKNFETKNYNYPEQSWYKEILPNLSLDDNVEWSSPYYEKIGSKSLMITAGVGIYDDNNKLVGLSTVDWEINAVENAFQKIKEILKLSKDSFALFAYPEKDFVIVYTDESIDNQDIIGKSLSNIPWYNKDLKDLTIFKYKGKKYIPFINNLDNGMIFIECVPEGELYKLIINSTIILCLIWLFTCIVLIMILYTGLHKNIIRPIKKLIDIANKISNGETDVEIKVEKPEEFVKLASTFDKMIKDIKTITKDRERINSELTIAKSIQTSSLPDIFPPFPNRKEFDIYATMVAAKEVGGDFYDFYFIDDDHFMFLIADVSGKGIPAALFMMTTKTMINNIAQMTKDPKELIKIINDKICASNKNGLFITMFAAIVDVKTGKMSCINCGHNPILIKQNNGKYKYLHLEPNSVLGVIEDAEFNIHEVQLQEGDFVFAYTDGITEAMNDKNEMYGEERLLNCLNNAKTQSIDGIVNEVKANVREFTGEVPQSDDMTMLTFKYGNNDIMDEKKFESFATPINYKKLYTWLHEVCDEWNLDKDLSAKIDMCAEEIYANIQFYAYDDDKGMLEVCLTRNKDGVRMTFQDSGVAYNPLEKPDPDITLPPEDRPIGGLGIFMVKQMTKELLYERIDDKNVLTLVF